MEPKQVKTEATVFVVDDDDAVLQSLRWLLESSGRQVECFASAAQFLDAYRPNRPGCLVLDIRMPGMGGLELQTRLARIEPGPPIVFITGYGDVPTATQAMRAGAVDFIEKPFSDQILLDRIRDALARDAARREQSARRAKIVARFNRLTQREMQVMKGIVSGSSNRRVAMELGLSEKTIETYRAAVMQKTQAKSLAELVRMALTLQSASNESTVNHGAA